MWLPAEIKMAPSGISWGSEKREEGKNMQRQFKTRNYIKISGDFKNFVFVFD